MRGIINGVSNSRVSEIKAPFSLNKKFVAFTLAEVLITLAIIGVVAALTIPSVVAKYQKKQLYTQFMKTFNTLSNAMSTSTAENGEMNTWGINDDNEDEIVEKYILPYLSVSKKIQESDTEYNYPISGLNGVNSETDSYTNTTVYYTARWNQYGQDVYVLNDGTIVTFNVIDGNKMCVDFDTNGIKGPNVIGRDLFTEGYCYTKMENNKYISIPNYMTTESDDSTYDVLKSREQLEEEFYGDDPEYTCTPDKAGGSYNCASRLMLEGKMDY